MKNFYIFIYLCSILLSTMLFSCYEDKSLEADIRYPELVADEDVTSYYEPLTTYFMGNLKFDPKVGIPQEQDTLFLQEMDDKLYDFEWRITQVASSRDTLTTKISENRILDVVVDMVGPATSPYNLLLKVVDKNTKIQFQYMWYVKVLSQFGQGLLITDTKDGSTSDINLLMSRAYNADFTDDDGDVVHRDLLSSINGAAIDGLIGDIIHTTSGRNSTINVMVPGKSLYAYDPITYEQQSSNLDMFAFAPPVYNPQKLASYQGGYGFLINNGDLQSYQARYGVKYNYVVNSPWDFDENVVSTKYNSGYYYTACLICYNKNDNNLVGFSNYGDPIVYLSSTSGVFDPANLPDLKLLYGDVGPDTYNSRRLLMQSTTTNKYYMYELWSEERGGEVSGKRIVDFSLCTDLKDASSYAFSEAHEEFYYGVGNQLKVALLTNDNPSSSVSYELPAGEEITQILIHRASYGETTWSEEENPDTGEIEPFWRGSQNKVITVCSYNSGTNEGFVRTLPIKYGGSGGIAEEKYVKTYSGFGKITALCHQR